MLLKINLISKMYLLIVIIALTIDLIIFKGNSGLLVMVTLPIAVIAMFCFFAGQFGKTIFRKTFFFNWIVGCILVLLGFICFPTKDSTLIFTYAMLITSPPASLLIGYIPNIVTSINTFALIPGALIVWSICITAACLQWLFVQWLVSKIRKSKSLE